MAKPGSVIGWLLAQDDRERLLEQFPPRFEKTIAHHVTLKTDAEQEPLPPEVKAEIVGRADDEKGVEAMVVTIDLTGLPLGDWAAPQKERWAAEHFPGGPIITTMARKKHLHMEPGDVLVDDRDNHRKLWEDAGGIFIHHKNARDSIRQLAEIYPSVKMEAEA